MPPVDKFSTNSVQLNQNVTEAKSIMEHVKTEFEKLTTDQYDELQKLREGFRNMRDQFTELLSSKFKEVDNLKQQTVSLESHVRKLEDADAYERRDTIIIIAGRNLPVSLQGVNCCFFVQKLRKDYLSFEIQT